MARTRLWLLVRNAAYSPLGRVSLAGYTADSDGLPADPMRELGSYGLVYILAGGGRYADGSGTSARVAAGDLLLLFPDVPHTYGPGPDGRWDEIYLLFDGPAFDLWRERGLLDASRPVHRLRPVRRWRSAFESVLDVRRSGPSTALRAVCRLQTVLAETLLASSPVTSALSSAGGRPGEAGGSALGSGAANAGADADSDSDDAWVDRACGLLERDSGRDMDLADVAAQLHMSYDGFRKRFRRLVGVSPARYRGVRTVDRAGELMATSDLSDAQIAVELGFCDPFYFSRRFTQVTGVTPSQFRRSLPMGGKDRWRVGAADQRVGAAD